MTLDTSKIRDMSLAEAKRLGYAINRALPLLDEGMKLRTLRAIAERILCLNAVVATAFGFPRKKALQWLETAKLSKALSGNEMRHLMSNDISMEVALQSQVDSLWALGWIVSLVQELDFKESCSKDFVTLFPNLKADEAPTEFIERLRLRDLESVAAKCDLAYCLHWSISQSTIEGRLPPGRLNPAYVIERRRALEWSLGSDDWDSVNMDT